MDEKSDSKDAQESSGWLKTIPDQPLAGLDKKGKVSVPSAYVITPKPDAQNGETLGSGQIVGFLGEGGMACVYKIWNESLEMFRSVKVLLPSGKQEVSDRFLTEARITAKLNHPNIVSVFEFGKWKGYSFIEMEFIDGQSLDKILMTKGAFPPFAAAAIGILITRALSYAHMQDFTLYGKPYKGVIHRDLKPANIMLENSGRLKLMDFGIARPISTGLHTMDGNIVGTLPYLSPEQLNHENVDQRTDIYAVGAILYELLSGVKAFPDERLTELVNKKESGTYIKFGELSVSVPPKLAEIADTCLKVDQNERYPDADTLADVFKIAYDQCTSERPETALKNFLEHPEYIPPPPTLSIKHTKEKKIVSRPDQPKLQLPPLSKFQLPKVQLPKFQLPKIQIPKISLPKIQLPHISLPSLPRLPNAAQVAQLLHLPWKLRTWVITGSVAAILLLPTLMFIVFPDTGASVIRTVREQTQNMASQKKSDVAATIATTGQPASTDSLSNQIAPADTAEIDSSFTGTAVTFANPVVENTPATVTTVGTDAAKGNTADSVAAPVTDSIAKQQATQQLLSSLPADTLALSTELYQKAVKNLKSGTISEAFGAITNMYDKDPRKLDLQFEFTEKCISAKKLDDARKCIFKVKSENARVNVLRGRVFYAENRVEQALDEYAKAMNLCIGSADALQIKSDILFCQAECYEMMYWKMPNDKSLQKAMKSWNRVLQNDLLQQKHYFAKHRLQNLKNSQPATQGTPPK